MFEAKGKARLHYRQLYHRLQELSVRDSTLNAAKEIKRFLRKASPLRSTVTLNKPKKFFRSISSLASSPTVNGV